MSIVGNKVALNYTHMGCPSSESSRAPCRAWSVGDCGALHVMHSLMEVPREHRPGWVSSLLPEALAQPEERASRVWPSPVGGESVPGPAPDVSALLPCGSLAIWIPVLTLPTVGRVILVSPYPLSTSVLLSENERQGEKSVSGFPKGPPSCLQPEGSSALSSLPDDSFTCHTIAEHSLHAR